MSIKTIHASSKLGAGKGDWGKKRGQKVWQSTKRRGQQRTRRLDGITVSVDISLSRLWRTQKPACWVHGVTKSRTRLSTWTAATDGHMSSSSFLHCSCTILHGIHSCWKQSLLDFPPVGGPLQRSLHPCVAMEFGDWCLFPVSSHSPPCICVLIPSLLSGLWSYWIRIPPNNLIVT